MDAEYRDVFEAMYTRRISPSIPPPGREFLLFFSHPPGQDELIVRHAIDEADAGLFQSRRRRLRADAKYFLLLNFMQMVFAPVRLRGRDVTAELTSSLVADINLVVNEAASQQQIRERDLGLSGLAAEQPDVSGHAVLEAVSNSWNDLKLSSFRIWGED
jgi:hypothetical protein